MVTQQQIYDILKELGGKALLKDIFRVAKEKYNLSEYSKTECCARLDTLHKWEMVDKYYDKNYPKGYTYVIKK